MAIPVFRRGGRLNMPRESCLEHRKREKLVLIRETFVNLCANDHGAASLLTLLEYLTNGELERMEKSEEEGDPWIRASMNRICSDMMDHYSRRSIQERMRWLREWRMVSVDDAVSGEIRRYLLNVDFINSLLLRRAVMDIPPPAKLPDHTPAKPDCVVADDTSAKSTKIDPLSSIKEEVYISRESINTLGDYSHKTPTENPTLDTADLYLEDPIEKFTQDAYSRINRSAELKSLKTKSSSELCERLRNAESDYGPVEFRGRLIGFLETEADWLRQAKWTIHAFLKDPAKYERAARRSPSPAAPSQQPPNGSSVPPHAKLTVFPEEADIWNEIVTAGTPISAFDWEMDEGKNLAKCRNHSQFNIQNWRKVCEKVQPVLAAGEGAWITFRWLIKDNNNWWKAFQGEYDNSAKPKANGKGGKSQDDFALRMVKEFGLS